MDYDPRLGPLFTLMTPLKTLSSISSSTLLSHTLRSWECGLQVMDLAGDWERDDSDHSSRHMVLSRLSSENPGAIQEGM